MHGHLESPNNLYYRLCFPLVNLISACSPLTSMLTILIIRDKMDLSTLIEDLDGINRTKGLLASDHSCNHWKDILYSMYLCKCSSVNQILDCL